MAMDRAGSRVETPSPQSTPEASLTLSDLEGEFSDVTIIPSDNSDDNLPKPKETKSLIISRDPLRVFLPTFRGLDVIASLEYFPQKMTHSFMIVFVCIHSYCISIVRSTFLSTKKGFASFWQAAR